jgi:superfamily II DNA/RNA helicase
MSESEFALEGLNITPSWASALAQEGIARPSPVQAALVGPILAGQDVLAHSATGTGKTLAYMLPLMQRVSCDPRFRVVIIAPSPELAIQILRVAETYKPQDAKSVGLVGGGNIARQKDKLKKFPQIMVGTPGRILELIAMGKIKLKTISAFVLDEADEILSAQNQELIYDACHHESFAAQLICASASYGPASHDFVKNFMRPERAVVVIEDAPIQTNIVHMAAPYDASRKEVALLRLLDKHKIKQALVFVNRLPHVQHLYRFCNERGVPTGGLSAEGGKQSRQAAIQDFVKHKTRLLVATDAVARGIDIKELPWVIHYEMARTAQTYLHRAGRVGRAGAHGHSLVLVAPQEAHLVRDYAKELNIEFDWPTR